MDDEDFINNFFSENLSNRERAAFELGIKLGALHHISMGIPISNNEEVLQSIELALQKSISCQPYVNSVLVNLVQSKIYGEKKHQYDYSSIFPECLYAEVEVNYKDVGLKGKIKWIEELRYPLMFIDEIHNLE